MKWSERVLDAWYRGHPLLILLSPLEQLYRGVVGYRRRRFLRHPGNSYRAPVPVIVVGNLTLGGTGKTPMILWLVNHCRRHGLRVGVVSRGYGAQPPAFPFRVRPENSPQQAGDEPLLVVQRTAVPLVIDPDRGRAVQALLQQERVDLLLSDDGLQHYRLARDLELVLVDAVRGLGNRHCLPVGPLREPVARLDTVDAVLCNGAEQDTSLGYGLTLKPSALVHLSSGRRYPLEHFPPGQVVHAVAGIGNPQRFFATVQGLGWQPIAHAFPDHSQFEPAMLAFSPPLPLVMTEKDAVKCREFAGPDWWYLEVQATPSPAFVDWFDQQLSRLLPDSLS